MQDVLCLPEECRDKMQARREVHRHGNFYILNLGQLIEGKIQPMPSAVAVSTLPVPAFILTVVPENSGHIVNARM